MCRIFGLRSKVTIVTAIAVMVCFSLAAAQAAVIGSIAGFEAEGGGALSGGALAFFAKSDDANFSQLQTDLQRFFAPLGVINGPGNAFYPSQLRISSKNSSMSFIDTILLKLRI